MIENYRPGVMARLGLDYAALSRRIPRLIYASISGHGQTGPWAAKGGFDLIAQGLSGLMSVTGNADGAPVKVGVPLTDLGAGLFALIGVLAALHHRATTGRGQHIDTSLVDAGLALSVWEATDYFSSGQVPGPLGSAHRMTAPYQAFRCADGYVTIGAANDRNFTKLARVLGHPEWMTDARFAADHLRVQHRDELAALIDEVTAQEPRAFWIEQFDKAGVPCGPILDYEDALTTPQALAREMTVDVEHPTLGTLRTLGTPIKMSADAAQSEAARADARRAYRRRAEQRRLQRRRDRAAALFRRRSIDTVRATTLPQLRVFEHRLHSRGSQVCDHAIAAVLLAVMRSLDPAKRLALRVIPLEPLQARRKRACGSREEAAMSRARRRRDRADRVRMRLSLTPARRSPHPKVGSFFPLMNTARCARARIPTRRYRPRRRLMPR